MATRTIQPTPTTATRTTPVNWSGADLGYNYNTDLTGTQGGFTGSSMTDTSSWDTGTIDYGDECFTAESRRHDYGNPN